MRKARPPDGPSCCRARLPAQDWSGMHLLRGSVTLGTVPGGISLLSIPIPVGVPAPLPSHDVIGEGADWWTAWNFDPQYLIPVALMGYLYARGLSRWQNRTREHSRWRTASYYAGLVVLVLIFESPLDRLG